MDLLLRGAYLHVVFSRAERPAPLRFAFAFIDYIDSNADLPGDVVTRCSRLSCDHLYTKTKTKTLDSPSETAIEASRCKHGGGNGIARRDVTVDVTGREATSTPTVEARARAAALEGPAPLGTDSRDGNRGLGRLFPAVDDDEETAVIVASTDLSEEDSAEAGVRKGEGATRRAGNTGTARGRGGGGVEVDVDVEEEGRRLLSRREREGIKRQAVARRALSSSTSWVTLLYGGGNA